MSEPTLYRKGDAGYPDTFDLLVDVGELVPVEAEEAWLTFEDIGAGAAWIVNHEEQPDYMGADRVLIVKIGGDDER